MEQRKEEEFRTYVAERIQIGGSHSIPLTMLESIDLHVAADIASRSLLTMLVAYMHGILDHKVEIDERFPEDWWEAFKERWFPEWALKLWPVKYRRIFVNQSIYKAVCPHICDGGNRDHLEWMSLQAEV